MGEEHAENEVKIFAGILINCLKRMINIVEHGLKCIVCFVLLIGSQAYAQPGQSLTLDSCYAMAKRNYPLVKQFELIERSKEYSLENTSKGYWPQFTINGQATYQSDVTQIPISIPNMPIPQLSKDQYRIYGEVVQPVTDLVTIGTQKEWVKTNAGVEMQKAEVEMYKLKERVNQLFFGMLLIDVQVQQAELLKKDLQAGLDKTQAAIMNGIALKSNADLLKAEMLKVQQRVIELKNVRKGYAQMLTMFTGKSIDENTILEEPKVTATVPSINRPELTLFEMQEKTFDVQRKLITARTFPRLSLFVQGGYGRPGLNMLNDEFDSYYIGGLRLNWNLSSFYTYKNDKQLLTVNASQLEVQKEVFLFNTNYTLTSQSSEIAKLEELIKTDNEIITLRENIRAASEAQLGQGIITANDYVVNANATDQARQNQQLHQVQLLMARYNYQTTSGN